MGGSKRDVNEGTINNTSILKKTTTMMMTEKEKQKSYWRSRY